MDSVSKSGHTTWIHETDDDQKFQVWAFQYNTCKWLLSWALILCSFGLVGLLFYWRPSLHVRCMCSPCSLAEAQVILIRDMHMQYSKRPVRTDIPNTGTSLPITGGQFTAVSSIKYFTHRKLKYIWISSLCKFSVCAGLDDQVPLWHMHQLSNNGGLSCGEVIRRLCIYGPNVIAVKLKPIVVLLFVETLSPFYVFQIFSVLLWYNDDYVYYASVIVLISVVSITLDVVQTHRQEKALRDMVHSTDIVTVFRPGTDSVQVSSDQLVPGDVMQVPAHGCVLQCDAVLLNGTCIVNESMLTGESVPVTKTPLPCDREMEPSESQDDHLMMTEVYSNKEHAKHTLYCGTRVLQTRFYAGQSVKALVIRTGYSTLKGQLVRSIMYPKPVDFQFTKDLLRFVLCLALIASVGFVYTVILMTRNGRNVSKIILRSLDIVTIVVPPALPAAMTIGIMAAQMRLKRRKVFCISPSTINTCGAINVVCFDKTGTLTEDGLDFNCVVPIKNGRDGAVISEEKAGTDLVERDSELIVAMASCHSLTRIEGQLCGDPLDLILFEETKWSLDEPEVVEESGRFDMLAPTVVKPPYASSETKLEVGVLRQFTFSSSLQRMSVMVRKLGEPNLILYTKGAPEKIVSLCKPESVPSNFTQVLQKYASKGYRVIALARREVNLSFVKAQRVARDIVECDLTMLGLVVLENQLKPQTTPVIQQLHEAHIRTIMVTGDNLLTAMSVARECCLIGETQPLYILETCDDTPTPRLVMRQELTGKENTHISTNGHTITDVESHLGEVSSMQYSLAMTGITFAVITKHYPSLIDRVVTSCNVFARMSPDQKQQLVGHLQHLQYIVAMCGDGANDCGALKAAHAGISLSEAEASIAAPFTSQIADIRCVPLVIRQGRSALVTSFGVFKYMAGYSLTQFLTVGLMYYLGTNLSDFMFLYIDLFIITLLAIFFGYTEASESLVPKPPPARILSIQSILSILFQLFIVAFFQIFLYLYVTTQSWFTAYVPPTGDDDDFYSYQNTCVFWLSIFQYMTLAVVYSKSHPYRKTIFSNRWFSASLFITAAVSIWWCIDAPPGVVTWLELKQPVSWWFRGLILLLAGINFVVSILCEMLVIEVCIGDKLDKRLIRNVAKYEEVVEEIANAPHWVQRFIDRRCSGVSSMGFVSPSPSSPPSSADEDTNLLPTKRITVTF